MDNPLYERFSEGVSSSRHGKNGKSQALDHGKQPKQASCRASGSRLSLDEAKAPSKPTRRIQSWSLSSRDYEGMWRTVQENVFKSTRDSTSALEDFNKFRQKLADLKQVKEELSAPPPTPKALSPSGSIRSYNLGSVSTRSLNTTPSRPTSPLQRLSVIKSRKGVSGLSRQTQSDPHRGSGQLPPRVHRYALSMRAEGLFKLPNPASISPLLIDQYSPPPAQISDDSALSTSSPVSASKRRFFAGGRRTVESKKSAEITDVHREGGGDAAVGSRSPKTPSRSLRSSVGGQTPSRIATVFNNELVESFMYSCSPRRLAALNTIAPSSRNVSQYQASKKKAGQTAVASSCSPRARDIKQSCIHISRPMCYTAQILE